MAATTNFIRFCLTITALFMAPGFVRSQGLPPGVSEQDGVLVLEDDGTLLYRDLPLKLNSPASIRFTPSSSDSFDAQAVPFAWEVDTGQLAIDRSNNNDWQLVTLPFSYTFGGISYSTVRLSRFGGIRMGDSPGPAMQRSDGTFLSEHVYDSIDCAADRTPRIFPLWLSAIHGRPSWYWGFTEAWVSARADRIVFTWHGSGTDSTSFAPIDYQLVLYSSGEFQFNYRHLDGAQYGVVAVITGKEDLYNSLTDLASRNSRVSMGLQGVRQAARRDRRLRFTALLHHITPQLLETFSMAEVGAGVRQALRFPAISFDAVKHLVLCAIEQRPPRLDLENYPHLPLAKVALTRAADYQVLLEEVEEAV